MRILHVFDHSLPLQSGYVTRSLGIVRSQRARGWHTIHVTTPRQGAIAAMSETFDGLEFNRTPAVGTTLPVLRELLEIDATRQRLAQIVQTNKPDVIHAHSPVLNVLPALSVARECDLPVVYEVRAFWEDAAVDHGSTHEGSLRYRVSRLIDSWAMRRADCVVPICQPLRREIVARGIPDDRVVVVPNAVDRSLLTIDAGQSEGVLREQLGLTGRFVLGFVGSYYAYEGLDLLLRAAAKLRTRADFSILLVGGGPEEARLKQLAEQLSVGDLVRFAGRVHHTEVGRYYRLIDILVFPRKRIRLTELVTPLKPLEAMAQSKPVLASDVGGHLELIRNEETGYLFPAGDEAALAARLEQLIADPNGMSRVAAHGRRFVETERTWDVLVDQYKVVYDRAFRTRQREPVI
jgi:PEP-CTERM/exosortase A-associated glycosyltransferase